MPRCGVLSRASKTMHIQAENKQASRGAFLAAFVLIFFSTVSAAGSVGFVPSYIDGSTTLTTGGSTHESVALSSLPQLSDMYKIVAGSPAIPQGVLPERIKSAAIDLDFEIINPETRDLAALDNAILKAPARYVDSAKLGVPGNMLIFAHSSTYRVVRNQMFKAFNNISKLKQGDSISIEGGGMEYIYSVTSVRSADANEAVIDLSPVQGTKLTLTTCDILTGKSARFIVEAEYVGMVAAH